MHDPRNKKLADVFLDHSLKVKKGDRLVISTSDLVPIDLIRECYKGALVRKVDVYLDVFGFNTVMNRSSAGDLRNTFFTYGTNHHFDTVPKPYMDVMNWANKSLRIVHVENKAHLAGVPTKNIMRWAKVARQVVNRLNSIDWVLNYYPSLGQAQDAGMSLEELFDFYYSACLVDYSKMKRNLSKLERVIDRGSVVRLKGYRTDLVLGIRGRSGMSCSGEKNIPDGEVFTGPIEDKTEGHIYYEFPGLYSGKVMRGVYLEFRKGKVIKATAETNQSALDDILNTDAGARRFGEFAIGANYSVQRHMMEIIYDEKIGGTIHTALGNSYNDKKGWGKNKSAIHWDIVKDMRKKGSEVWIDKKLVLKDGKILV